MTRDDISYISQDSMDRTASAGAAGAPRPTESFHTSIIAIDRLRRRKIRERWFAACGKLAVLLALVSLIGLLVSIIGTGYKAFYQHVITLEITLDEALLDPDGSREPEKLRRGNYRKLVQEAIYNRFPEVTSRQDRRALFNVLSTSGAPNMIRQMVYQDPSLIGGTYRVEILLSDQIDQLLKGNISRDIEEKYRKVKDNQIAWVDALVASGEIKPVFNKTFFTATDSRDPELAGLAGALIGSAMALSVAFLIAVPMGVGAAIYLDEFAPKNKMIDFIEININNLAAVPSIVFGLLGLAVFLNFFDLPRSAPLVGGMVLALMTFPTIIIATRSALRAVSPSIRDGALSVGASHVQAVFHHKLPLATPGIMTGSIIGMARALGETAPLLMIGMVAFITELPAGVTDAATALPVQIYLWYDSPERAWAERTSAAIIVLLGVLVIMNTVAIFIRSRFERRW